MTALQNSDGVVHEAAPSKLIISLNIVVLLSCVAALLFLRGQSFINSFWRIKNDHIYIEVSNWDAPAFASLPCFLALIVILTLRLSGYKSEVAIQKLLKISVFSAVAAIFIRLPMGYLSSSYLGSAGYSPCWELSSPSLMAPTVWVSNTGYCLSGVSGVRDGALEWIDAQTEAGNSPTPSELASVVDKLR